MANVLVNDLYLGDIADAIRSKLGVQTTYKPSQMANAIESISGGGSTPVINPLSVTENGTYTAPSGVDGYSPVTVNVSNTYSAGDEGKVVSNGALVAQTSDTVTSNGTVDTTLINSLLVNVSGGSSNFQIAGGTFTPSSNVNTIEVDVDFEPTHAICYPTSGFDETATGWTTSWQEFGNVIFNTSSFTKYLSLQARINNSALQVSPSSRDISLIGYNNGKFKFYDGSYKFVSGITYAWYCWREMT